MQKNKNRKATPEQLRSSFVALAVLLHKRYTEGRVTNPCFPLHGVLTLRSNISLVFNDFDIHDCELGEHNGQLWLNILTLAGVNGVLPLRMTEDIQSAKKSGGDSLHEFFDLLNRRFWEILFQSYRIGTRPQYGFHNQYAKGMIQDIAQGYVGLRITPTLGKIFETPNHQAYLLRHCFQTRKGTGISSGLAELLSQAISRPVSVSDWATCQLPIPERFQLHLGPSRAPTLLGCKCILGRKTKVRRFLIIDVGFDASDWKDFCPAKGRWAIRALISTLHATLADRVVVLAANYRVRMQPNDEAQLGQITCRLGWGAAIAGAPAHTNLIRVSPLAISNIQ